MQTDTLMGVTGMWTNAMRNHSVSNELQKNGAEKSLASGNEAETKSNRSAGFSLIEVCIALVILLIALLGVATVFGYTIVYNAGNKSRAQALTVLQQEVERYRAAKFNTGSPTDDHTPGDPDDGRRDITGGEKPRRTVTATNGYIFFVDVTVDDDPFTAGVQDETESDVCTTPQGAAVDCTIKEITITATLAAPSPGWQTAVPATVVLRRVRGN